MYFKIIDWVEVRYNKVDVKSEGLALRNRQCHLNSYENYINNGYKVVPVICVEKTKTGSIPVFIHFINKKSMGIEFEPEYIDVTLGNVGRELYDYYIVDKAFEPRDAYAMLRCLDDLKIFVLQNFYKSKRKCKKLTDSI